MNPRPRLRSSAGADHEVLSLAYAAALRNLLDVNTIPTRTDVDAPVFIRAGGGYPEPWTRDAAINSWHAASLLAPQIAADTLLKVCDRRSDGTRVIAQDNQWWDQIIWVIAAWHHVATTGDEAFAKDAYQIGRQSHRILHRAHYNATFGLYMGGALMQDGISGYPSPPYEPDNSSTFVLGHARSHHIMCLSTNAVYARALADLGRLAQIAGEDAAPWQAASEAVAAAINSHLWNAHTGLYGYFIGGDVDAPATLDNHQEAAGLALAIEFGVADAQRTASILANTHREPRGVVNVWPHFDRFSPQRPGRHNAICWPMVMGLWAFAAACAPDPAAFGRALDDLLDLFHGSGYELFEVYHAVTGAVDGGWQHGAHWQSLPDQTWSATALLRLVHEGLFGMRFTLGGIRFRPTVPPGRGGLTLTGLAYRGAVLDMSVEGDGSRLRGIAVDGVPIDPDAAVHLPASLVGRHGVALTVG